MTLATLGIFELTCRFLVFSELPADWGIARRLRSPALWGDDRSSDLYWEMQFRRTHGERRPDFSQYDPRVGYTEPGISPVDFEHQGEKHLDGRRPILLFGDSFAACEPSVKDLADFQTLFECGPLAEEYALLNYATRGHGLDQILLTMRRALERHAHLDPLVVASFFVDEDIDRCVLAFRGGPKPRFRLEDGDVGSQRPLAPRAAEYFERHATSVPSVGLLLLGRALLGRGESSATAAVEREKQQLGRAVLESMVDELRARDLSFYFLLYLGGQAIEDPEHTGWREPLAIETLEGLGAPWSCVRPSFEAHMEASGLSITDYFIQVEPERGHYNPLGNQVAFRAFLDGLRDHLGVGEGGAAFATVDFEALSVPRGCRRPRVIPRLATQPERVAAVLRRSGLSEPVWALDPCSEEPYELRWSLRDGYTEFRARTIALSEPADADLVVGLAWLADERVLAERELRPGEALHEFALDVSGVRELRLRARARRPDGCQSRLFLDSVELIPRSP